MPSNDDKTDELFEYQILASALRVPGAIERFNKELATSDVGLIHGLTGIHEIYKTLLAYHNNIDTDIVDPIGFKSWLKDETDIVEAMGGMIGVDRLIDHLMHVEISPVDTIIKLTGYRANQRRQLDKLQELKTTISSKGSAGKKELEKIESLTKQIRDLEQDLDYDPLASVRTAINIAEDIDELWDIPPFLPTQFPSLNKAMGYSEEKGGFMRGAVTTIAALSGLGKSTLARCLCNYWLDTGYTVLFINFEEAKAHWERTLMTQIVKKNIYVEAQTLSPSQKYQLSEQFTNKLKEWGDRLMIRHDPDTLFFEDLERWLRDVLGHGARKPDVVVIDTIQSMFTKSGGKARWGEFEQIMVGLEKLAKDMDAVFIITAQQNITSTKEKREVINQSDMGGSVTITQKSSVVLFLTPVKDATGDETFDESIMQVQIPKNRITGTAFANNPPMLKYRDDIKSYVSYSMEEDARYDISMIDDDEIGAIY